MKSSCIGYFRHQRLGRYVWLVPHNASLKATRPHRKKELRHAHYWLELTHPHITLTDPNPRRGHTVRTTGWS